MFNIIISLFLIIVAINVLQFLNIIKNLKKRSCINIKELTDLKIIKDNIKISILTYNEKVKIGTTFIFEDKIRRIDEVIDIKKIDNLLNNLDIDKIYFDYTCQDDYLIVKVFVENITNEQRKILFSKLIAFNILFDRVKIYLNIKEVNEKKNSFENLYLKNNEILQMNGYDYLISLKENNLKETSLKELIDNMKELIRLYEN